uniref:ZU5 domain-containing protein n=1 Tax=Acrobeloides nanus TaxID=290746 RepID=A0A914D1R0_9BILA
MLQGDSKSVESLMPKQRRTRTCNNPAPLNGGQQCFGEEEEFQSCSHNCLINGAWSRWSPWSECNDQCQRVRSRSCAAPSPANGGAFCQGLDLESTNCTASNSNLPSHCLPGVMSVPIPSALPSAKPSTVMDKPSHPSQSLLLDNEVFVYASLGCVAFLLLIIMALVAALFCRRRRCFNSNKKDNIYFPDNSGHVRTMLLQQKQSLLGDFIASEAKLSRNSPTPFLALSNATTLNNSGLLNTTYTLKSAKSINSSGYSVNRRITGSRAALITDYSSNGSASSGGSSGCGKITLLRSESRNSADENYATLYDYTKYTPSIRTCTEDFSSSEHDQSATIIAAQVDSEPSRIELKRSGVALSLSTKTFLEERMIFLAVSDDINERPFLQEPETCLSSVIIYGLCESEPETVLCRPAVISFEHCASMFPKDNWQFIVYVDWGQGSGWEVACRLGEENLNTPVYAFLERQRCHLMTDQFGRFCLVGRPKRANVAAQKRVHLAAYCTPMPLVRNELSIR